MTSRLNHRQSSIHITTLRNIKRDSSKLTRSVTTLSDIESCDIDHAWIAFDLLSKISGENPNHERILSRITVTMPVGDYSRRITFADRYAKVDERLAELLNVPDHDEQPLTCIDIGASNGVTSLKLYETLLPVRPVTLLATDKCVSLQVITLSPLLRTIYDQQGQWVQIIVGKHVGYLRQPQGEMRRINHAVTTMLAWWLPSIMKVLAKSGCASVRDISLFHPRVTEHADKDSRFRIGAGDLFELDPGSYAVVRAMSVIFNWPDQLKRRAVRVLANATADGGLLIIGQGGGPYPLRCSIFRREGNRMRPLEDVCNPAREFEIVSNIRL